MAFKVKEINGASGTETEIGFDSSLKLQYEAWGTTLLERNDNQYLANLLDAVRTYAPLTLNQLPTGSTARPNVLYRGAINWNEDEDSALKRRFLFDVEYKAASLPPESESLLRWSFDTQGGSVKVFTSQATAKFPNTAPSFNSCIDVNDDAEVQGVEIVIPALKLSCRKRWIRDNALYKWDTFQAYIRALASVTGTTNNTTWQGYSAGELLFLGATGEFQDGKDNEIEYHFAASANVGAYSIGAIALSGKRGHDYFWIRYEHAIDSSQLVRKPKWAYVERVYGESAFSSVLGIS
jgi:hypothetical protein